MSIWQSGRRLSEGMAGKREVLGRQEYEMQHPQLAASCTCRTAGMSAWQAVGVWHGEQTAGWVREAAASSATCFKFLHAGMAGAWAQRGRHLLEGGRQETCGHDSRHAVEQ